MVTDEGAWGPLQLPVLAADEYVFSLEGAEVVKEERTIVPPNRGEIVDLEFLAERGLEVSVSVKGPAGEVLPGARVQARWQRDTGWLSDWVHTDSKGMARIQGLPQEVVYLSAEKDGYVSGESDPIDSVASVLEPIVIQLDLAGTVVGRCVHGRDPVRSFELLWWKDFGSAKRSQVVHDDPNGRFTIVNAPLGEITLMAISEDYPQTQAELVTVEPYSRDEIVLRFEDGISGRGTVVDALTSLAIPRASIQVLAHMNGKRVEKNGTAWKAGANGDFEIAGLIPGGNPIDVSAEGYATRTAFGTSAGPGPIEFGVVPLYRKQSAEIQLISSGQEEYDQYLCEVYGAASFADRHFALSGKLGYEALDPGSYGARIVYPGQLTYRDIAFTVTPDSSVSIRVPVDSRTLDVRVIPEAESPIPDNVVLCVQSEVESAEFSRQYYGIPENGQVQVFRAEGSVVVSVETWDGELKGITRTEVLPNESPAIEVRLDNQAVVFKVVDMSGRPVPGVTVFVNYPSRSAGWSQMRTTDAAGQCSFPGLSLEEALVLIHKFPVGYMSGQRIGLSEKNSNPIELVLDPNWDLRVLLMERSSSAGGVDVITDDPHGLRQLPRTTSDSDGLASIARVSGAGWKVRVAHPGYWATAAVIGPSDPNPFPIQVRRLGSVEFHLNTPYGNPAVGVAIELRSEEMTEEVALGIETGRVHVSNSNVRTGADGTLRYDALPNGPYHWYARTQTGETLEGDVQIPPQATALVESTTP